MNYSHEFLRLSRVFYELAEELEDERSGDLTTDSDSRNARDDRLWDSVSRVEKLLVDACHADQLPGLEARLIAYSASIPTRFYVMMGVDLSPLLQDQGNVPMVDNPLKTEGYSRIRLWLKVAGGPVFSTTGKGYLVAIPGVLGQMFKDRMPSIPHEGNEVCLSERSARREFWSGAWLTRRWGTACKLLGELAGRSVSKGVVSE